MTPSLGTRTETVTGRPCTSSIAPARFATRRSVRVTTVVLKPPFARCSPKPSVPQPRQEQPLDEVRWLRTSGAGWFRCLEVGAATTLVAVDKVGRKPLLLIGSL